MTSSTFDHSQPNSLRWHRVAPLALVLILIFGAVVRFSGLNWDEDQHLHPDERFLTMVSSAISIPGLSQPMGMPPQGCAKWGSYFDTKCSPLNPYNHDFGLFVYGTFPIFLTRLVGELLGQTGYGEIHLVGRVLSALFDLTTVLLIFFIGRRMYGIRVALLGALFLAASVLDIQQSHFFTVDTFTNVPILLAFWCALDIADGKPARAFVYAGAAFGLALAGRINIAPFAVVLIAAGVLRVLNDERRRTNDEGIYPSSFVLRLWSHTFIGLATAALVALIVFRIFQPYAAMGPNFVSPALPKFDTSRGIVNMLFDVALSWAGGVNPKFADNMTYISELVAGRQDYPPGHQWTNRPAYIFPFQNMVLWGLGPALGLAAWAGFAFAFYRLIRYREWQHLLIVTWVGITFAYTGQQWVKTLRYFLQIYPFLALLAGWFIVELWDRAAMTKDKGRRTKAFVFRLSSFVIALVVIGYTVFWAIAFATIYTRPVSRVTASRWIFANVPRGATLANEHWDDPLPLRVDGRDPFGGMYRGVMMHWYDEDTPEKRAQAIEWIDQADYIILSSNRLYGSIPRLPMRYPLTTKYYEWLFDGTLGFDKVAQFTSRPQLFGIEINDDDAEEAFTVYDHPKVLIFQKSPRYSRARVEELFNSVDLTEVYRFWPREATAAPTALLLTPADREAQTRGGTWSQIFNPNDFANRAPVLVWLALIEFLGWLAFPIAFVALRALADRGYIFAKAIGVLLPAWGAWTLASYHVLPFSRASITIVIACIALASVLAAWWRGRDLIAFLRARWKLVLIEEIAFLIFFGAFLLIRYGNPDLWHQWFGGEKPMDFAHLNAVIKSTWFPPYDPWFAGGYLNYYYFGQVINATLIKFSGIVPEVAYNLLLPMYFALTAMGAFSVVLNLSQRSEIKDERSAVSDQSSAVSGQRSAVGGRVLMFALLGAIFVAVMGNLGQAILIGQNFIRIGGGDPRDALPNVAASLINGMRRVFVERQPFDVPIGHWYWNATRIIPETINEFPFFTFLYADLHAHLMALPFTLVVIGFCVNFIVRDDEGRRTKDEGIRLSSFVFRPFDVIEVVALALVFGALRAINFADFPTYLLLIGCALAIGEYARRETIDWAGIVAVAWRFGAIVILGTLLYYPFVKSFASAYFSIELWKGERTGLGEYLVVHGIFLFVIVTWLVARVLDTPERRKIFVDVMPLLVVAFIVVETAFILTNLMAFAIAFPLLALALILLLRPDLDARARFVALLIAAGLAMTMMVEVVVYKGDIGRMNTVFKFYLQVWVFFALASAVALASLARTNDEGRTTKDERRKTNAFVLRPLSFVWSAAFALLVFIGLLYPITATRAKVHDRYTRGAPPGLNGMEFMRGAIYQDRNYDQYLESDYQAIQWLRANIEGSPVILEGNAPLYHWASRVSIYTGLPTVVGWDWHQKQQRSIIDGAIIDRRIAAVREIYNTRSTIDALTILKRFRVQYVYVGDLERAFYDAVGLAKFDAMARAGQLQLVYENERVKIYKVLD